MTILDGARTPEGSTQPFQGGGEMGALIRSMDWSQTQLGSVAGWSPSLRNMVQLLLANRFPLLLWWGPEQCQIYNDAYRPVLGMKHPYSMGQPARECWTEIWDIIGPLILTPFTGGPATWDDDLFLVVHRNGFAEETHFTIAYSPVPDESAPNGVGGVLATVHEITQQVVQARRVAALRELGARSSEAKTAEEACRIAAEALGRYPKDIPFALLYLIDADRQGAHLAGAAGITLGEPASPTAVDLRDASGAAATWPFVEAVDQDAPQLVTRLEQRFGAVPAGPWSDPPTQALALPIPSRVQRQPAGLLVLGLSARLAFDDFYRRFCELATAQVATAIANARAYAEERQRAETLAELDRVKTAFFSNISHEFRTPITLLLGPLEEALASQNGALDPAQRAELEMARRNALRLLRLVNAMLDFAQIEAGRIQAVYEPVDLAVATGELASVFRSAIERAGLRLVVDCPPLAEPVYVDRNMWEQIVLNLLSNAFKHTFAGEIAVTLRQEGSHAVLAVRDTGTGIPATEVPHLFERFHRVRGDHARTHEGSGIGLALVQELVRLHDGTVTVVSTEGEGSTFTVTLPTGSAHLPADRIGAPRSPASILGAAPFVEEALRWLPDGDMDREGRGTPEASGMGGGDRSVLAPSQPLHPGKPRILLADDNADMREYVRHLLGGQYVVEAVADGEAALATARERQPDLVLTDVMMPRLDGFGLLAALRAEEGTRVIPVVLLSARAGEEARVEGLGAGADDYVVKPFSARELLARVQAHVGLGRMREEAVARERAARAEAEAERARLQQVLDVLPAGVAIAARDGRIIMTNRAARELLGVDATGLAMPIAETGAYDEYGARRLDGSPYPSLELPLQRAVLRQETVHGARFFLRNGRSGGDIPVLANSAPLFDAGGAHVGGVVVFQDITAIHDVDQLKDAFLSAASHDLQQPVAAIKGHAQLLRRWLGRDEPPDRERLLAGLTYVEEATGRLSAQVRELMDTSRLQMGRPLELDCAPTDLVELAQEAVAAYQGASDDIRWRVDAEIPSVTGSFDRVRLRRALDNLLSNAAKFSSARDEIVVRIAQEADEDATWAVLTVRDHGVGIPPADLPHIFERFYRARNVTGRIAGTGIGLAGARQIVEQHGGTISAKSEEGAGATFTIRLPLQTTG